MSRLDVLQVVILAGAGSAFTSGLDLTSQSIAEISFLGYVEAILG